MDTLLTPTEARVIGALMEKERITPDAYPLTTNSLIAACNQTTSRDPVVSYDEATVNEALDSLRAKKLVVQVHQAGSRVVKYAQHLSVQHGLKSDEHAVLCLLLLRGPQTTGELNARSGRLHTFADLAEVEATLNRLAEDRYPPRVIKLPRQPGTKESRYAHTLCGEVEAAPRELSVTERLNKLEGDIALLREELSQLKK